MKSTLRFILLALIINSKITAQSYITIGPGIANSSVTLLTPNHIVPYNCFNNSGHVQYVYSASELFAGGATGPGNIDSLGWDVVTQISSSLPDYTIKLKNTLAIDVSSYDNLGLQTVFNMHTINPSVGAGFRMFGFDTAFYWDGVSNILVDVCWNKIGTTTSTGSIRHFGSSTITNERLYVKSQTNDMCGVACTINATFKPFIKFSYCNSSAPCFLTTSVSNIKETKLSIYPNPNNGRVLISNVDPFSDIKVFDFLGNILLNFNSKNDMILDLSHLSNGIYYIENGDKKIKFIKY